MEIISGRLLKAITSLSVLILFFGCNATPPTSEALIQEIADRYSSHQSMSYEVQYRMKYIGRKDTLERAGEVLLQKIPEDTLFGGYLRYQTTDTVERYYDGQTLLVINHHKKNIKEYDPFQNQIFAITGNITGAMTEVYFLDPDRLWKLNDTLNQQIIEEAIVVGQPCWKLIVNVPDSKDFSDRKKVLWVGKKDFLIHKMTYQVKYQGDYQFEEWNLENIRFDEEKIENAELNVESLADYDYSKYQPKDESYYATLEVGAPAPNFAGEYFQKKSTRQLSDNTGQITILDFWYMSCFPCIKAIPELNEVYETYREKGVDVWGVDSKDLDKTALERLPEFIQRNEMKYPVVLTDPQTDESFNVKAYPTLYVIDQKGKVAYAQVGFNPSLSDTLSTVLDKLLQ